MSQEISTVFRYNGQEYPFDSRDAEDMERFENALDRMQQRESEIPKTGRASELQRAYCAMLKKFFDETLGTGAGTAICTEKDNIALCNDAYLAFLSMVKTQKNSIVQITNTYKQYSNRKQRRHPQGGKPNGNFQGGSPHTAKGSQK